jgi:hypothetical protein
MPVETVANTDLTYYLIAYDADGKERTDDSDGILSQRVMDLVKQGSITDILLLSHGWKGDVPAAKDQYNRWIAAATGCTADLEQLKARPGGFKPLVIGLHWPSLPFGDEEFDAMSASFGPGHGLSEDELVERYASRLVNTPEARKALRTIVAVSRQPGPAPARLPDAVRSAYVTLDREVSLASEGPGAAPGADHEEFEPDLIFRDATSPGAMPFSIGSSIRDALLSPLRQLSFWRMKDRARQVGEAGVSVLVRALLDADPNVKLHLMGHSFGCIVVLAALAGPPGGASLSRSAQSLVLVQGALSLWSYCSDIPAKPGTMGYFHSLVAERRVVGPVVTTRSRHDRAVGWWYPLGARVAGQVAFALGNSFSPEEKWPTYGAVGAFGLRGPGFEVSDGAMFPADMAYDFRFGHVYNLDGSRFIYRGGGASGAHSDIDNKEVAHVVWAAVLARPAGPGSSGGNRSPALETSKDGAAVPIVSPPPRQMGGTLTLEELLRAAGAVAKEMGSRIRIAIEIDPPNR